MSGLEEFSTLAGNFTCVPSDAWKKIERAFMWRGGNERDTVRVLMMAKEIKEACEMIQQFTGIEYEQLT